MPEQLLRVGSIPSWSELTSLRRSGYTHLVNVSGVDLVDMYLEATMSAFSLSQFAFSDVFSVGRPVLPDADLGSITEDLYISRTDPIHRQQLLDAVAVAIDNVQRGERTYVFCHRGQGRSPTVAAAVLKYTAEMSTAAALRAVKIIRPGACLTDITVSAIGWSIARVPEWEH